MLSSRTTNGGVKGFHNHRYNVARKPLLFLWVITDFRRYSRR